MQANLSLSLILFASSKETGNINIIIISCEKGQNRIECFEKEYDQRINQSMQSLLNINHGGESSTAAGFHLVLTPWTLN